MTNTTINEAASRTSEARSKATTAFGLLLATLVAALLTVLAGASPAKAATTFTVDNAADLGNGICNTSGGCTLRDAITAANNTPNSGGPDLIRFDIQGDGPHSIRLKRDEPLPTITDPVVIDGYTQQGSSPNTLAKGTNAKLMVELDGEDAGLFASALDIRASSTVVRGLAINRFSGGVLVCCDGVQGVKIEGNFIGTDSSGTQDLGNGSDGVKILLASRNTVGGATPAARNLISGNDQDGVSVALGSNNKVYGNLIGTKNDGKSALGNADDGVDIYLASGTRVGSKSTASANKLAYNGGDGVEVLGEESARNRVLRNSIYSNSGLGIDLVEDEDLNGQLGDGPTKNDGAGDADAGPNGLQNKPVLTSAVTSGGKTTIKGKLLSAPNKSYVVRFYLNPKGTDEGKKYIIQKKVTTDGVGKATLSLSPARKVRPGKVITATATGLEGTSEFSAARTVVSS